MRGEDVSSERQRYFSSYLGEVQECEWKCHSTAGGVSPLSCCYGHTSAAHSAGDYGRVKALLLHQLSQTTALMHQSHTQTAVILGNAVHLSPVNMRNPDYTDRTRIRVMIQHLETSWWNNPIKPGVLTLSYTSISLSRQRFRPQTNFNY